MKRILLFLLLNLPTHIAAGAICSTNFKKTAASSPKAQDQSIIVPMTESALAKIAWHQEIYPGITELELFTDAFIEELTIETEDIAAYFSGDIVPIDDNGEALQTRDLIQRAALICLFLKAQSAHQFIEQRSCDLALLIKKHIKTRFAERLIARIKDQEETLRLAVKIIADSYSITEKRPRSRS